MNVFLSLYLFNCRKWNICRGYFCPVRIYCRSSKRIISTLFLYIRINNLKIYNYNYKLYNDPEFQVLLSIGCGTWLIPKTSNGGIPIEFDFLRRASGIAPLWLAVMLLGPMLDKNLNHERCGLTSSVPLVNSTGVMMSDELKARILCGKVKIKDRIVCMEGNVAHFDDGTTEAGVDVVMFATGFKQHYPFLEKDVMPGMYQSLFNFILVHRSIFFKNNRRIWYKEIVM